MKKFPVVASAIESFEIPRQHPSTFLQAASGWIVLTIVSHLVSVFGLIWAMQADSDLAARFVRLSPAAQGWLSAALPLLIGATGGVAVAVTWHRFAIMGERPQGLLPIRVGRVVHYFGRVALTIGVILIFVVLAMPVLMSIINAGSKLGGASQFAVALVPFGVVALMFFVMVRTGLALPSAAVADAKWTLERSWHEADGNGWRLFGGTLLVSVPFYILNAALRQAGTALAGTDSLAMYLAISAITYAITLAGVAVAAGFYSLAYIFFSGAKAENRPPASHFS